MRPSRLTSRRAPIGRGVDPEVPTTVATATNGSLLAPFVQGGEQISHAMSIRSNGRPSQARAGPRWHNAGNANREFLRRQGVARPRLRVPPRREQCRRLRARSGAVRGGRSGHLQRQGPHQGRAGDRQLQRHRAHHIPRCRDAHRNARGRGPGDHRVRVRAGDDVDGRRRATATISTVTLTTDFTVVGRVAQFGRGIMEDVSRHLVGQAAECIQAKLEAPAPEARLKPRPRLTAATAPAAPSPSPAAASQPAALDALALGRAVAKERLSRLPGASPVILVAFQALILLLLIRRFRRARRRRRAMND